MGTSSVAIAEICVDGRLRGHDDYSARSEADVFDIKWIRDNPAAFDAGLKKRGLAPLSA